MKIDNALVKKNQHYIFLFLDLFLNIFNYFFHIFVAWYLLPKEYGTLNSLLSLASILFVGGMSVQLFVSKAIANGNSIISFENISSFSVITFPFATIFLIFLMPYIKTVTNASYSSVVLLIIIYFVNIFLCLLRGVFQGETKFLMINYSMYIEVLSKMFLLFLVLPNFKNIEAVLLSILFGMCMSLTFSIYHNRHRLIKLKISKELYTRTGTELMVIVFSNIFLYYFTSVDMIFVNKKITGDAGTYAVVLRLSQLITFGYFSLFILLNPWMSSKLGNLKELKISFKKYAILFTFLNLVIVFFYFVIVPKIIPVIFGEIYKDAVKYISFEAFAYIILAMSFFMVNIFIQLELKIHLIILSAVAILLTLLYFLYPKDIFYIIKFQIMSYTIMFASLLGTLYYKLKEGKQV